MVFSVVMQSMMQVVNFVDEAREDLKKRQGLVKAFTENTWCDTNLQTRLERYIEYKAQKGGTNRVRFDTAAMHGLIVEFDHSTARAIIRSLYGGRLRSFPLFRELDPKGEHRVILRAAVDFVTV